MNLTIRLLGCEVLHVSTEADSDDSPGDVTTQPIGFTADDTAQPIREPGRDLLP